MTTNGNYDNRNEQCLSIANCLYLKIFHFTLIQRNESNDKHHTHFVTVAMNGICPLFNYLLKSRGNLAKIVNKPAETQKN